MTMEGRPCNHMPLLTLKLSTSSGFPARTKNLNLGGCPSMNLSKMSWAVFVYSPALVHGFTIVILNLLV